MRICTSCVIRWDFEKNDPKGKDCPKCKTDSFFTMDSHDNKMLKYCDRTGDTLNRYLRYDPMSKLP